MLELLPTPANTHRLQLREELLNSDGSACGDVNETLPLHSIRVRYLHFSLVLLVVSVIVALVLYGTLEERNQ